MNDDKPYLILKWGTIKGWGNMNKDQVSLLKRWSDEGVPFSAITEDVTDKKKDIICELIDTMEDHQIYNDWTGDKMAKEDAKKYIIQYGS